MPGMDGYETLKNIKANEALSHIPVVFLTANEESDGEFDGLNMGAADYIVKPFSVPLFRKRIELHLLLAEQNKQISELTERLRKYE
jgi:putative two-component system response regulator